MAEPSADSKQNLESLQYLASIAPDMSAHKSKNKYLLQPQVVHDETIKFLFGGQDCLDDLMKQEKVDSEVTMREIMRAVDFLHAYTEYHIFVLHACIPGYNMTKAKGSQQILQPGETRESAERWYGDTLRDLGFRNVGDSGFFKISLEQMSPDQMDFPMTSQCNVCRIDLENLRSSQVEAKNKMRIIVERQMPHIETCKEERDYYNKLVEKDVKVPTTGAKITELQQSEPNKSDIEMHYTFDCAEKAEYLKGGTQKRKCNIFAVCCEGIPQQMNYLMDMDENECGNINANLIVRLLHHFFYKYGLGEKKVHLHCDNCRGQNKNNLMLWYLAWRVMEELHTEIELHFMPAAHSKFYPDEYFLSLKKSLHEKTLHNVEDIANEVKTSRGKINRAHIVRNANQIEDEEPFPQTLNQQFNRFEGMNDFHHFKFASSFPGEVHCCEKLNDQHVVVHLSRVPRLPQPPLAPPQGAKPRPGIPQQNQPASFSGPERQVWQSNWDKTQQASPHDMTNPQQAVVEQDSTGSGVMAPNNDGNQPTIPIKLPSEVAFETLCAQCGNPFCLAEAEEGFWNLEGAIGKMCVLYHHRVCPAKFEDN